MELYLTRGTLFFPHYASLVCVLVGQDYHFCQQGAASVHHEGMSKVDLPTVHLELHITELRVVHHAAQV